MCSCPNISWIWPEYWHLENPQGAAAPPHPHLVRPMRAPVKQSNNTKEKKVLTSVCSFLLNFFLIQIQPQSFFGEGGGAQSCCQPHLIRVHVHVCVCVCVLCVNLYQLTSGGNVFYKGALHQKCKKNTKFCFYF